MLEQERKRGNTAEGGQWYDGAKSALKMVKILEPTYKGHNEELKILVRIDLNSCSVSALCLSSSPGNTVLICVAGSVESSSSA